MSAATVLTRTDTLDRPGWLNARRNGLGGSDAAAILGLDRFNSPLGVYLDKRGELEDDEAGEAAEWGNRLEPVVAEAAADRMNQERKAAGLAPLQVRRRLAILQHPQLPWMLANVDREVFGHEQGPGILEVKTTGYWAARAWEDDGDDPDGPTLPDRYHIQLQHYLAVTGRTHGWVAVLIGGQRLLVEHVDRDQEMIDALIEVETAFWQRVQDGNPPPAGAADDELTKKLTARVSPGTSTILPADAAELLRERAAAKAVEAAATDRRKAAEAQLRQLCGEADEAYLPGTTEPAFTYREVKAKRFDGKRFAADHPDLDRQYRVESSHRRFSFPEGA